MGVFLVAPAPAALAKIKPYYSGKAASYNGNLIIGTADMGEIEIFRLDSGELVKTATIQPEWDRYSRTAILYDLAFSEENGKLYLYAVTGNELLKYDITEVRLPILTKRSANTSWDWFTGVGTLGDKIYTVGKFGIKIWTPDMVVINSYAINNPAPANLSFDQGGNYIFSILNKEGKIDIYDTNTRQVVSSIPFRADNIYNRGLYTSGGYVYFIDDSAVKKTDFSGKSGANFVFKSKNGYDVRPSADPAYFYFTDGVGVVKARTSDLEPVKWAWTTNIGQNCWAMGLRIVKAGASEYAVVFNNSNILVLDGDLKLVTSYESQEDLMQLGESLALSVDKARAPSGAMISLHGQGYGFNEPLDIFWADTKYEIRADDQGRFRVFLEVPKAKPGGRDITVTGKFTGAKYSLGFQVE